MVMIQAAHALIAPGWIAVGRGRQTLPWKMGRDLADHPGKCPARTEEVRRLTAIVAQQDGDGIVRELARPGDIGAQGEVWKESRVDSAAFETDHTLGRYDRAGGNDKRHSR